jgi:hypothetical protein
MYQAMTLVKKNFSGQRVQLLMAMMAIQVSLAKLNYESVAKLR